MDQVEETMMVSGARWHEILHTVTTQSRNVKCSLTSTYAQLHNNFMCFFPCPLRTWLIFKLTVFLPKHLWYKIAIVRIFIFLHTLKVLSNNNFIFLLLNKSMVSGFKTRSFIWLYVLVKICSESILIPNLVTLTCHCCFSNRTLLL